MIDLHCHILPGVDDGAKSLEESLLMARRAVEDGIHTIVATPHTLNGIYINSAREVTPKVASLQETLSKNHIKLQLYVGADVHLCPHMLELIESGDAGTINNARKYILLEFPSQVVPPKVKDEIFSLKLNGITPIISHLERNPVIQHNIDILYEFIRMGALCQVTAMSITGDFGGIAMQCAERLLRHRMVHVIASDAHSSESRPPVLSQAVEAAAEILENYDDAERMVTEVPAAILSGNMPDIPKPKLAKRGMV
ncbi:MAG: tyrosine protein phosphatase [Deltaproteobacteria bacterium]|nr:MAG: tyrosine protein phosphatase [Deltaproteobacteria bacterium]